MIIILAGEHNGSPTSGDASFAKRASKDLNKFIESMKKKKKERTRRNMNSEPVSSRTSEAARSPPQRLARMSSVGGHFGKRCHLKRVAGNK